MTDQKGRVVRGFMCKTDFDDELGVAYDGVRVFASEGALRDHFSCVDECGIVEVEVSRVRVIQKSNFNFRRK